MNERTFTEAAREALSDAMEADPTIFVVGEGVGIRGGNFETTAGLYDKYGPMRLCDTPICERGFIGMCTGAAMTGTRPVVDFMFMDFILDGLGELINQTSKMQYMSSGRLKMPMVLRGCIGIGHSAATHHSGSYYPMLAHIPGFHIALPSNPADAKGLFSTALRSDDPVFFMEHRDLLSTSGPVPDGEHLVPFGQAAVVREGTDATVVALSVMVNQALHVAEEMSGKGVSLEIIDPRTVAPLDVDTILGSVRKTGRLLIVDETFMPCGIGAEISAHVTEHGFDELDAPIKRLNGAHVPTPYSPTLEHAVIPDRQAIEQAVRDLLAE